ncbi:MAG TPA: LuxR C-terminal-related transcriptional regulator [Acidimicrobiales bacterium]|nr:LuxR C-terminal-related transcriptional regulator [Acidimicrobiales bacterium]
MVVIRQARRVGQGQQPGLARDIEEMDDDPVFAGDLTASELGTALGTSEQALVLWRASDGVVRLANAAAAELTGEPLEDLVGRSVLDFVVPRDVITRTAAAFSGGTVDEIRAKRRLLRHDGTEIPYWVWSRAVDLDGERYVLSLVVPRHEVGRLGRDLTQPWRYLTPIAIGLAGKGWVIRSISTEIYELTGLAPADCVGMSLLDLVHPDDVPKLVAPGPGRNELPVSHRHLRVAQRRGEWSEVCLLAVACAADIPPRQWAFVLVGTPRSGPRAGPPRRLEELEMRLRRIGAEVRAAGVLEDAAVLVAPPDHPALRELTTRQWEILSRLLRGERVQTIAREVFLSQSTVRNHLSIIFRKFGVRSQAELLELLRRPAGA